MTSSARLESGLSDRLPEGCVDALLRVTSRENSLPLPRIRFPYNSYLMKEGEIGDRLYVLLSGKLVVERADTPVVTLENRGAFVGEIAALYEGVLRTASVKAGLGGSEAIEVSTRDFAGLVSIQHEPIVLATSIISQTARLRIDGMSESDMRRSRIPDRKNWFVTEEGQSFPPLRHVAPTRLALV